LIFTNEKLQFVYIRARNIIKTKFQSEEEDFKLPPIYSNGLTPSNYSAHSEQNSYRIWSPRDLPHCSPQQRPFVLPNIQFNNPLFPKNEKRKILERKHRVDNHHLSKANEPNVINFRRDIKKLTNRRDTFSNMPIYPIMNPHYACLIAQNERMEAEIKDLKLALKRQNDSLLLLIPHTEVPVSPGRRLCLQKIENRETKKEQEQMENSDTSSPIQIEELHTETIPNNYEEEKVQESTQN
jgi:hypothetical protein